MRGIVALLVAGMLSMSSTQAAMLTFEMSMEFSAGASPEGPTPWLTATFDDGGGMGAVDLTLTATNLISNEFVLQSLFNLDPILDPNALVFSSPTKTGAFTDPIITTGVNAFMADGGGMFDIKIDFDDTNGASTRFGAGDAVMYTITGIPTLTADSFDFLSQMSGGAGTFPTASQVGGIGALDLSGWVSVAEPTTIILLGVAAFAFRYRR